ncbi:MAG: RHS repeat domain-containing protein, partial [Flavobacteriaceae bacterium]
ASIKNYESPGQFSNGKQYQYVQQNRNFRPTLYEFRHIEDETAFIRKAFQPRSESSVTYSKVREFQIDQDGESEGYVEHTFYGGQAALKPNNTYPHENNYFPSVKGGKLKNSTIVNSDNEKVQSTEHEFFETYDRPIKVKGMTVFNDDEFLGDYIYIKDNFDGTYGYDHVTPIECSGASLIIDARGIAGSGGAFCAPLTCVTDFTDCYPPYVGAIFDENGGLTMKSTFINGAYGGISVKRDTTFLKDALEVMPLVTVAETKYEIDSGHYFPVETKMVDSKGGIYRTTNEFPDGSNTAHNDFYARNRLNEIISSKTEKVDENGNVLEFISASKRDYYVSNSVILPSKVYSSKVGNGASDYEQRAAFTYYANGNVRESRPTDGMTTTYLWGYGDMYPIAKIDNATAAQVTTATTGLDGAYDTLAEIEALADADDDRTQGYSGKEGTLRQALDALRAALPDGALMTGYTYDPLIGVTSITDPKGYTTYYQYDGFNRLEAIKDAEGNLVEDYEYHYKNQQPTQ